MGFTGCQQVVDGAGNIVLTHQGFTDEETACAGGGHADQIIGGEETTFTDHHAICGDLGREFFGRCQIDLK